MIHGSHAQSYWEVTGKLVGKGGGSTQMQGMKWGGRVCVGMGAPEKCESNAQAILSETRLQKEERGLEVLRYIYSYWLMPKDGASRE